ncbi:hypothetical protein ACEYW6_22140 [Nostoc sp. UIC 10607]|uniref:hypothetical protein n=1 Tax=Nostoc sp. UIC 10607 TaxID=3045935 RepID=UPI0039A3CAF0
MTLENATSSSTHNLKHFRYSSDRHLTMRLHLMESYWLESKSSATDELGRY